MIGTEKTVREVGTGLRRGFKGLWKTIAELISHSALSVRTTSTDRGGTIDTVVVTEDWIFSLNVFR